MGKSVKFIWSISLLDHSSNSIQNGQTLILKLCALHNNLYDNYFKWHCYRYCGHGSGSKFLPGDAIQTLQCRAVALVMGCSSGKLTADGKLEATGLMLDYLLAGW